MKTDHQGYVRNCFWIPRIDGNGKLEALPISNKSGPVTCSLEGYAIIPRNLYNQLCLYSKVETMATRLMGANVNMEPKEPKSDTVESDFDIVTRGLADEVRTARRMCWADGIYLKQVDGKLLRYSPETGNSGFVYTLIESDEKATDWEILDAVPAKKEVPA